MILLWSYIYIEKLRILIFTSIFFPSWINVDEIAEDNWSLKVSLRKKLFQGILCTPNFIEPKKSYAALNLISTSLIRIAKRVAENLKAIVLISTWKRAVNSKEILKYKLHLKWNKLFQTCRTYSSSVCFPHSFVVIIK